MTSSKRYLTSAQESEIREAKGLTKQEEMTEVPFFTQLPTFSTRSTSQGGTVRIATQPHSLTVELVADQWENIVLCTTDNLPAHIKGAAEWVEYNEPNRSCYMVRSPGNAAEEWPIELINGEWYLLTWENTGWQTKASRRLNDGDHQTLNLGWFNKDDAEHPDYHPLFPGQETTEEEPIIPQGSSKGKGVATRPPSMDIHSPRDPEPAIRDESEASEGGEEPESSQESPTKRPDTPMPGQWGHDLHEEIAAQQLEEVVTIDPGDFGDPMPEYGQLPKNTNAAARAIMREDPPGTTPTIAAAVLRTTIGVNTAFTPSFWKTGVASQVGAQIATTKTTSINPAFVATAPYTGIAKALVPSGGSGGGSGGGRGGGGGGLLRFLTAFLLTVR